MLLHLIVFSAFLLHTNIAYTAEPPAKRLCQNPEAGRVGMQEEQHPGTQADNGLGMSLMLPSPEELAIASSLYFFGPAGALAKLLQIKTIDRNFYRERRFICSQCGRIYTRINNGDLIKCDHDPLQHYYVIEFRADSAIAKIVAQARNLEVKKSPWQLKRELESGQIIVHGKYADFKQ